MEPPFLEFQILHWLGLSNSALTDVYWHIAFKLTYWKVIMIIFVAQVPQLLRLKLRMVPSTGWIMLTVMETKRICLPVLTYSSWTRIVSVRKTSGLGWLALQHLRVVRLKTDLQFFNTIIIIIRAQMTLMLSWHRPTFIVTQLAYFLCNPKFIFKIDIFCCYHESRANVLTFIPL